MSLQSLNSVDAIGLEKDSGHIILSILDSWDWIEEQSHLLALQEKFNAYLGFVQGGQLGESYPKSVGREIVISLVSRFPLPSRAKQLVDTVKEAASKINVQIRCEEQAGQT